MRDRRDIEELKRLGAGRPASAAIAALYGEAFEKFGAESLWSRRRSDHPTITQALVIAESLRMEGSMRSWLLAAQIEECCRAAL